MTVAVAARAATTAAGQPLHHQQHYRDRNKLQPQGELQSKQHQTTSITTPIDTAAAVAAVATTVQCISPPAPPPLPSAAVAVVSKANVDQQISLKSHVKLKGKHCL